MGYVSDAGGNLIELRNERIGQSIAVQQILLDAIDERLYDPTRSVSAKIQGRIITLQ